MGIHNSATATSSITYTKAQAIKSFDCGDPTRFDGSAERDIDRTFRLFVT